MYEICTEIAGAPEAGRTLVGRRSGMRAAFTLARKTWREFNESARVIVTWDGLEIASDPSEFTMSKGRN